MEITLNQSNFEKEVLQSDKTVLIDFFATWCGPCRMLSPVIAEIAKEHPEIKVCRVNVDEEPALASAFQVTNIPLVVAMKGNQVIGQSVGYKPKEDLLKMVSV